MRWRLDHGRQLHAKGGGAGAVEALVALLVQILLTQLEDVTQSPQQQIHISGGIYGGFVDCAIWNHAIELPGPAIGDDAVDINLAARLAILPLAGLHFY